MGYFGIPFRNGVPIGLGSIAGFGAPQEFSPSELFLGGTAGAWYDPSDLTTLFTTSAGTTQCAMPGLGSAVSVGLMLDKSQNGVGTNGAKRVNLLTYSEDFSNAAWVATSVTVTQNSTVAPDGTTTADTITHASATGELVQTNSTGAITVICSFYAKYSNVQWIRPVCGQSANLAAVWFDIQNGIVGGTLVTGTTTVVGTPTITSVGNGWYRCSMTVALGGTGNNFVQLNTADANNSNTRAIGSFFVWGADLRLTSEAATLPLYQRIDANWYSTMAGNHAIAFNDTTARPELRARVNLLTYSEEFDNAAWTKANVNIATNSTAAPNGTITAETVTPTTASTQHYINSAAGSSLTAGASYKQALSAKANGYSFLVVAVETVRACFDLSSGTVTGTSGSVSASISSAGNGWWNCSITWTSAGGTHLPFFIINDINTTATRTFAGDGASGMYFWGADLRPANIGANVPAYQRIADANTYDTSGFPLYLRFDGIDDSMYTPANLNLSGTDKVSVFAGVRKLSDAAAGVLTEFTADINANNSSFIVTAPSGAGGANYLFGSKGTIRVDATGTATFAAPVSSVVCGIGDIAGDVATLRVNGSQNATNAANQGAGNYANAALYIGSRANTTLYFNGHLHSLIIAGSAVSAGNISATEQWVAQRTGIVL